MIDAKADRIILGNTKYEVGVHLDSDSSVNRIKVINEISISRNEDSALNVALVCIMWDNNIIKTFHISYSGDYEIWWRTT